MIKSVSRSSAGASDPIDLAFVPEDAWDASLAVSATVSSGADLIYSIEVTGDIIYPDQNKNPAGDWIGVGSAVDLTASKNERFISPATGVRINITSHVSGEVTLHVATA